MEIRVYQIYGKPEERKEMFRGLDELNGKPVDSAIYDEVFAGFVKAYNLEKVYEILNGKKPKNYHGVSLSVSDVVEVVEAEGVAPGFYYCDRFGFKRISFQPELVREKLDKIHVVLLEPGKLARETDIDCSLEGLWNAVDGRIEYIRLSDDPPCGLILNEEGKLRPNWRNRVIPYEIMTEVEVSYAELTEAFRNAERCGYHLSGQITFTPDSFNEPYSEKQRTYCLSSNNKAFQPNMAGYSIFASCLDESEHGVRLDRLMAAETGDEKGWKVERCVLKTFEREGRDYIAGTGIICGEDGENFASLAPDQCKFYLEAFKKPEYVIDTEFGRIGIPYEPHVHEKVR